MNLSFNRLYNSIFNIIARFNIILILITSLHTGTAAITWSGYTWRVTTGGLAGNNRGSADNVFVDSDGYLHMKISQSGNTWYCAEIFTNVNIGFGTYQWQIDAPVDKLDRNIVVGLFPYGPAAGIGRGGTNEIDIEFARWGNNAWPNGNFAVYPNSGDRVGSHTYEFDLDATFTTSTFVWSSREIEFFVQEGLKEVGDRSDLIETWTYAPSNPSVNLPQRAMPLGMNLWLCVGSNQAPSNGQGAEIIVRRFTYVPLSTDSKPFLLPDYKDISVKVSLRNDGTQLHFNRPAAQPLPVHLFDLRGSVVRRITIPAHSKTFTLDNTTAGVCIIHIPDQRVVQKSIVVK